MTIRRTVRASKFAIQLQLAARAFFASAIPGVGAPGPWGLSRRQRRWWAAARRQAAGWVAAAAWPHLLFAAATVASIVLVGYHFGTFDQAILFPFLQHSANPALYAADPILQLMPAHVTYFWDLFVPAYRAGMLAPAVFAGFVLVSYLFFWSVWSLSQELFHNRLASVAGVVALIVPHFSLGGFSQVEFSLLTRTAVMPFILWALTLFLRRRTVAALALLGLLYNFHVLTVNFALGLVVFASLSDLRRVGARSLLLGLAAFTAAALPALAWKASAGPLDLSLRPEWFSLVERGGNVNVYAILAPTVNALLSTGSAAAAVALFFIARRLAPPAEHDRVTLRFMWAGLLVTAVQVVVSWWLPVTLLLELQLSRVGVYLMLLGYLYFAAYLARAWQAGQLRPAEFGALLLALALPPVAFVALALWLVSRWLSAACRQPAPRWQPALIGVLACLAFAISLSLAARMGLWDPRLQVEPVHDDWYAAQQWARDHTAQSAMFITPPQIQGFFTPGWRVYSERGSVVTLNELEDVGYSPSYLDVWQPRFEALAPGATHGFRGDWSENARLTASAFYGLSDAQLLAVAGRYGASYLVVERPHARPWPVAYQNAGYIIYDLRALQ